MRWSVVAISGLLTATILAAGYYIYETYDSQNGFAAVPVETSTQSAPVKSNVTADGTIQPIRHATLAFKLGGTVAEVAVKQGDLVQSGVVLARLDDNDLRNQLTQADAALDVAKRQLAQLSAGASEADRQAAEDALAAAQSKYDDAKKAGADSSALKEAAAGVSQAKSTLAKLDPSPQAIAVMQAQVNQAQAADDSARGALDQATVKAPFGGTVAQVNVNIGDFVGPGIPVVILGDLSRLRVESEDISDLDIRRVRVGQAAAVTLDSLPGRVFHGSVATISPLATESRGYKVFPVTVDLKEGTESGLRWGMDAKIEITADGAPTVGQ